MIARVRSGCEPGDSTSQYRTAVAPAYSDLQPDPRPPSLLRLLPPNAITRSNRFNCGAAFDRLVAAHSWLANNLHSNWSAWVRLVGSLALFVRCSRTSQMDHTSGVESHSGWRQYCLSCKDTHHNLEQLTAIPEVWSIILSRFLTDPVWWLYITWLPKYLADARGFTLTKIALFAWVPYVASDAGSLSGG